MTDMRYPTMESLTDSSVDTKLVKVLQGERDQILSPEAWALLAKLDITRVLAPTLDEQKAFAELHGLRMADRAKEEKGLHGWVLTVFGSGYRDLRRRQLASVVPAVEMLAQVMSLSDLKPDQTATVKRGILTLLEQQDVLINDIITLRQRLAEQQAGAEKWTAVICACLLPPFRATVCLGPLTNVAEIRAHSRNHRKTRKTKK